MGGNAKADAAEARASEVRDRAGCRCRHDEGKRPRPESLGQPQGRRVEDPLVARGVQVHYVGDERVELRPILGAVDPGHRLGPRGVGAEAVDGLGRERDETPFEQQRRGHVEAALVPIQVAGSPH
jgi:hypothetical protein